MSTTVIQAIIDITDLAAKISRLTTRINIDPDITTVLNSVTYVAPNIIVNFNTIPTLQEVYIVGFMLNVIFFNNIPGVTNNYNNIIDVSRNVESTTSVPTNNFDVNSGYNIGSRIFNATNNKMYTCLNADTGSAVWLQLENATNAFDYGEMYLPAPPPTGSTYSVSFTQASITTTFSSLTSATNVIAGNLKNVTFNTAGGGNGPRLTVGTTGTYLINYGLSVTSNSNAKEIIAALFVNGSVINKTFTVGEDRRSNNKNNITWSNFLQLNEGDVIGLRLKTNSGTVNFTVFTFNVNLLMIST